MIIEGNPSTLVQNLNTNLNTTQFLDELKKHDLSIYKISVTSSDGRITILYSSESGLLDDVDENTSVLPFWGLVGIIAGASVLILLLISFCLCRHCRHRKKTQQEAKITKKKSSRLDNSMSPGGLAIIDSKKHSTKKIIEIEATTEKIPTLVETHSGYEHGNRTHIQNIRSDSAFSRQESDSRNHARFPREPMQHSAVIPTFQSERAQSNNVLDWLEAQQQPESKADVQLGVNRGYPPESNMQKGATRYLGKQTTVAGSIETSDLTTTAKPIKGSPRKHLMRYIET